MTAASCWLALVLASHKKADRLFALCSLSHLCQPRDFGNHKNKIIYIKRGLKNVAVFRLHIKLHSMAIWDWN